ncbi:hypothetical protein EAE96_003207 [Botrytis aclada]|nr:hypothetical protein EAE96_003207 [Botrytis aclada]
MEALFLALQFPPSFLLSGLTPLSLHFPQLLYAKTLDITEDISLPVRWFRSQEWLIKGRTMLIEAYVPGNTYMLPTRNNYCVFISGENIIKEFASSSNFSLSQAYNDLFSYRHNKLWRDQGESIHTTRAYFFKILREGLTTKLPTLYPSAHKTLLEEIEDHFAHKKSVDGWKSIHHYQFLQYITVSFIGPILWGESLWAELEFQNATRKFPAQYFAAGEIVQHVPTIVAPVVKFAYTRGNKYRETLIKHLIPVVREQVAKTENTSQSEQNLPFVSFIQYAMLMTKGRPYWTAERIVLLLESLWRASGSPVPMTVVHIVNSLCQRPENIEPMREEIDQQKHMDFNAPERLPLPNSFIKAQVI